MKKEILLRHIILLFLISLILIRFDRICDISSEIISWILLLFTETGKAFSTLNLDKFDNFLSIFFLINVIILFFLFKEGKPLSSRINFLNGSLTILTFIILFAPLVATQHPNFFKDVGTSKLLPPMSSKIIFSTTNSKLKTSSQEDFIFLADSCKISGTNFCYFQKGIKKTFPIEKIKTKKGEPIIKNNIFILGTDQFGRDVFSRVIYGARLSITIGFLATLISLIIGISLGFWAGFANEKISTILTSVNEIFLLFPMIFLAIMVLMLFGSNLISIIMVLGLSGWMGLFKIVKEEVIKIKSKSYFLTSKAMGVPKRELFFLDIFPIISIPISVNMVFQFGNVIIAESALSFLGLSLSNDFPSWGSMIENGQEYIKHAWWLVTFPSIALILTLLTSNNLANFINKKLDPRI